MGLFTEQVIIGVSFGSRLFLIALGLTLIFGVMDVLNFAHGVFYMLGGYLTISFVTGVVENFWIGIVVASVIVGIIGIIVEMGLLRHLEDPEHLDQLLVTFGVALIVTDLARTIWGTGFYTASPPPSLRFQINTAGVSLLSYRYFVILVSIVSVFAFWAILQHTNIGRIVRATSTDKHMASLIGVNVPRLYTGVFFAGSILAGIGGGLAVPLQSISTTTSDAIIVDAFIVVVIGGMGSFIGAFIGAMIVGIFRSTGILLFGGADLFLPFIAMILVLLVRPEGLFGGEI